ncbi:cytochrome P450 6B5 [Amyelois transitella]|uniref:cytochrome P450 6B5 n=1 Tax=Amyelois transitella TaxID=680683 RepID=UPI002990678E|nr:cytochrome P450 6B5 [Amyelois transitella]
MIGAVLALLSLLLFVVYHASTWKFNYWKKRKVPFLQPAPIVGNYGPYIMQKQYVGHTAQEICEKFPNEPYFGAFYGTEPTLMVQHPEMIKTVMTKDFYFFNSREIANYTHKELVTQSIFFTYGDKWKVLRQNLTPIFSSAKMKNMFHLIDKCAHVFENMLDRELKTDNEQYVRPLMTRFTMDCIGSCAFGIETNTMAPNYENNPFTVMGTLIFSDSYYRNIKNIGRAIWPAIFYGLGMQNFPIDIGKSFTKLMKEVFADRQNKPSNRNDFIDLILNWKKESCITGDKIQNMKGDINEKVSLEVNDDLLVSQISSFFAAGYETSATTMHYTLYELAKNQEAQQRVLDEIDEYLLRHKNKIGFDCITDLPFTDACFNEVLRLYPVLGILTREVVDDYTLPCGAVIEKGVRVHIPVHHLHHNPDFFPDPEEFRPERFYGDEKRNIKPYTYIPFGEGPRLCMGMRFAKMQMSAGIMTVLKKYRVELAADTPRKVTQFEATTMVTLPKEKIKLKFVEREGWQQRQYSA